MIYITRRERFSAAHRLFRKEWSNEKNLKIFGNCSNPNWHGHNYILYVTIKGEVKPDLGYLTDLKELSRIIREYVIDRIDHRNINLDVDFMAGRLASTENLTIAIWEVLQPQVKQLGVELHCIKLEETENNFVEYYGI